MNKPKITTFKLLISIFLIGYLLLPLISPTFANEPYFTEEFNSLDKNIWDFYPKEGTISLDLIDTNAIFLSADKTKKFPFVVSKTKNIFPTSGDFSLEIKLKYVRATTKGTGFAIGTEKPLSDVETETPIHDPKYSHYNLFHIWQDSITKFTLNYTGNCYDTPNCTTQEVVKYRSTNIDLNKHVIKLEYKNGHYHIYLDTNLIYSSPETNIRPSTIWFGNNTQQGESHLWTSFKIDYIFIKKLSSQHSYPLIFLPGMTACWNKALLTNVPADNWILPGFAQLVYGNLISTFQNAEFADKLEWHLFCYDWRKPLEHNTQKLNDFIKNTVDPPGQVNLVGHSMGGLISRVYAQLYPENVNLAVTLGSPHKGAVTAYPAWEGGQLWGPSTFHKSYLKFLLRINNLQRPGEHLMHTIRRVCPSVKDLLPTFDFLIKQNTGEYKYINNHIHQNEFMTELNNTLTLENKNSLHTIFGNGQTTLDALKTALIHVPHANYVHQIRGLWEDGEPIHTCPGIICEYTDHNKDYSNSLIETSEGDGTVLVKSATLNEVNSSQYFTDHTGLAKETESVQKILGLLGIDDTPIVSPLSPLLSAFILYVRSPANVKVIDPDGKEAGFNAQEPIIKNGFYDPEAKFLLVPNFMVGEYQIIIKGTKKGIYKLTTAYFDQTHDLSLHQYQFPTHQDKTDNFIVNLTETGSLLVDPNGSLAIKSATTKLKELQTKVKKKWMLKSCQMILTWAQRMIQKGNYQKAARLTKTAMAILNEAVLETKDETLFFELLPKLESVNKDLTNLYSVCSKKANLSYSRAKIKRLIKLKEKFLVFQNSRMEKKYKKGQEIPLSKIEVLEITAKLLQEAKNELKKGKIEKAFILELQAEFFLWNLVS